MSLCGECGVYDPIDEVKGKCKKGHAERHIKPTDGCVTEVINGWPEVLFNDEACQEFE